MLSTAFRPNEQMNDPSVVWIPKSFTLDNIKDVWGVMKFEDTVVNTVILNLVVLSFRLSPALSQVTASLDLSSKVRESCSVSLFL